MSDNLPTLYTCAWNLRRKGKDGEVLAFTNGDWSPGTPDDEPIAYVPAAHLAALQADLARVTKERDDFAKGAFNLADEAEQSKDCGESQGENCCGECIACRDVTLADTASKLAAAREREQALVALLVRARQAVAALYDGRDTDDGLLARIDAATGESDMATMTLERGTMTLERAKLFGEYVSTRPLDEQGKSGEAARVLFDALTAAEAKVAKLEAEVAKAREAGFREAREQAAKVAESVPYVGGVKGEVAWREACDAIRALAPAETHAIAHAECGRPAIPGDPESGPADCDCACRGSAKQADCARAGCGFCRVVEKPARPAPNPPRHPADAAFDGAPNYVPPARPFDAEAFAKALRPIAGESVYDLCVRIRAAALAAGRGTP